MTRRVVDRRMEVRQAGRGGKDTGPEKVNVLGGRLELVTTSKLLRSDPVAPSPAGLKPRSWMAGGSYVPYRC